MTTFDTNVVVRLIVEDDEIQSRQAETAWRQALAEGSVFLPKIVIVETVWVLRTAYRFDRSAVAKTLQYLLDIDRVFVEDESKIRQALSRFERGSADLSDYLILESAHDAEACPVQTFDRRFAKETDVVLIGGPGEAA